MTTLATVTVGTLPWQATVDTELARKRAVRLSVLDAGTVMRLAGQHQLQMVDVCHIVNDPAWQTEWGTVAEGIAIVAGIAGRVGCTPAQVAAVLLGLSR